MLRFEKSLPKLPVPILVDTTAKWLDSVQSFVAAPPSEGSPVTLTEVPSEEFEKAQQAADEFVSSPVVRQLHERLKERARETDNWLADWWNEAAYFAVRDPVVPYVNYFYYHKDDKQRRTCTARAASLTRALLLFRKMVETQILEPEMVRQTPLAMSSYEYLFNACRFPGKGCDTAQKFDPEKNQHIVVVRKNKFFQVSVLNEKGDWLSEQDFKVQFDRIVEHAGAEADPHPVGALTTANRDVWAKARRTLLDVSSKNRESLERIESAIIVIALDETSPTTREEVSRGLWVGDGCNRFFDKHQIIVFENGKSGFNGEHSCMDGTPTSRLNDWLLRAINANKIPAGEPADPSTLPLPQHIPFDHSPATTDAITKAVKYHQDLMAPYDIEVLNYERYGKNVIKNFKVSPDSWAQLCMQLAYFKMTGELAPTYESAQTRKFKRGRTEVIRSATAEALDWCRAMESPRTSNTRKLELLRRAVNAHGKYAAAAADGRGVDRHFFGLKKLLRDGEKLPALFENKVFKHSSHWILSTSQLTSEFFDGWGYGPVVEDGFGLAYAVNSNTMRFTITSTTGLCKKLRHYLAEACTEVMEAMSVAVEDEGGLGRSAKL